MAAVQRRRARRRRERRQNAAALLLRSPLAGGAGGGGAGGGGPGLGSASTGTSLATPGPNALALPHLHSHDGFGTHAHGLAGGGSSRHHRASASGGGGSAQGTPGGRPHHRRRSHLGGQQPPVGAAAGDLKAALLGAAEGGSSGGIGATIGSIADVLSPTQRGAPLPGLGGAPSQAPSAQRQHGGHGHRHHHHHHHHGRTPEGQALRETERSARKRAERARAAAAQAAAAVSENKMMSIAQRHAETAVARGRMRAAQREEEEAEAAAAVAAAAASAAAAAAAAARGAQATSAPAPGLRTATGGGSSGGGRHKSERRTSTTRRHRGSRLAPAAAAGAADTSVGGAAAAGAPPVTAWAIDTGAPDALLAGGAEAEAAAGGRMPLSDAVAGVLAGAEAEEAEAAAGERGRAHRQGRRHHQRRRSQRGSGVQGQLFAATAEAGGAGGAGLAGSLQQQQQQQRELQVTAGGLAAAASIAADQEGAQWALDWSRPHFVRTTTLAPPPVDGAIPADAAAVRMDAGTATGYGLAATTAAAHAAHTGAGAAAGAGAAVRPGAFASAPDFGPGGGIVGGGYAGGAGPVGPATGAATATAAAAPLSKADKRLLSQTPLMRSVHRLRHAARHVKPRNLLSLVEPWWALSTVANVFNFVYAALSLVYGEAAVPGAGRVFLACAVALDWLTLLQYFKYNGNYYLLVRTFRTSAPAILRNVAGSLPIFGVFAICGMLLFGGVTERFDGLPFSSITLFAVANGDIVRETFQTTYYWQVAGSFGQQFAQLFMYVYTALFMYVILKTTTAINEQSYLLVRPLPPGLKPGLRAEDVPDEADRVDRAPLAFRLPLRVRRLLNAMQALRDAGGSVAIVTASAAASMPYRTHRCAGLAACLSCGVYSPPSVEQAAAAVAGSAAHAAAHGAAAGGGGGLGGAGGPHGSAVMAATGVAVKAAAMARRRRRCWHGACCRWLALVLCCGCCGVDADDDAARGGAYTALDSAEAPPQQPPHHHHHPDHPQYPQHPQHPHHGSHGFAHAHSHGPSAAPVQFAGAAPLGAAPVLLRASGAEAAAATVDAASPRSSAQHQQLQRDARYATHIGSDPQHAGGPTRPMAVRPSGSLGGSRRGSRDSGRAGYELPSASLTRDAPLFLGGAAPTAGTTPSSLAPAPAPGLGALEGASVLTSASPWGFNQRAL